MKNWIIVALVALIAVGGALAAFAQTRTVDRVVEVRVWESVEDPSRNYLSIRARGGSWVDTHAIDLSETTEDGRSRYVDLAYALPVSVPGPDQLMLGMEQSSGHWSVNRLYDPIHDRETILATLATEAVIEKVWTSADFDSPFIQIYCRGDELQSLIYWDKPIFAPVLHNPIPTIRSVYTIWRVDGGEPIIERWLPATHGMGTFAQHPDEFIGRILGAETLVFRVIPSNGEEHTLTMDISGLDDVLGNLTCYGR